MSGVALCVLVWRSSFAFEENSLPQEGHGNEKDCSPEQAVFRRWRTRWYLRPKAFRQTGHKSFFDTSLPFPEVELLRSRPGLETPHSCSASCTVGG